jgi:hypothetical protein
MKAEALEKVLQRKRRVPQRVIGWCSRRAVRRRFLIAVVVAIFVLAAQSYEAQALLAAWLFFSLLFAVAGVIVLTAFLLGGALDRAASRIRIKAYRLSRQFHLDSASNWLDSLARTKKEKVRPPSFSVNSSYLLESHADGSQSEKI